MLHHILSFLSQKEAIQTCVLSKSWRYLGSTRPNFESCERWFNANKQTFLSTIDKILHRYHDQKLSIQEFILEMSMGDSESILFFEKWIPLVMLNMGLNTFSFKDVSYSWARFALPSLVYKDEFVKELNLNRCKLSQINPLDKLSLIYCHGFEEIQLLSHSIKFLAISVDMPIKAAIDATHILYFEFRSDFLPSISFKTTSSEWKSDIRLSYSLDTDNDASSWFLKLNEILKALSHSEISLRISPLVVPDTIYGGFHKAVLVENLCLRGQYSYSSVTTFLNGLFRICHPRYIGEYLCADPQAEQIIEDKQFIGFLCKILLMERERRHYLWQQDLEEVSLEAFDNNGKQWNPVQWAGLSECAFLDNQFNQRFRFCLKWRES
ncbi:hypothetical protein DH2020_043185 [Rehmannia glutinosa]|uniref:F-box protein n=1 Tax=Rehmannia glutinosa TaxID=99300 RepID=A0ABR0UKU4_REHGL